jgi:hypothetical protein
LIRLGKVTGAGRADFYDVPAEVAAKFHETVTLFVRTNPDGTTRVDLEAVERLREWAKRGWL